MIKGAIDQAVDAAKARFRCLHQPLALTTVGDVGRLLQYLAVRRHVLHAPLGVFETRGRASGNGDMGTFAGRFNGKLDAEARADSRDDDNLVLQ